MNSYGVMSPKSETFSKKRQKKSGGKVKGNYVFI